MKMRIEAQQLQVGDVVGSGEVVSSVVIKSIHWPSSQMYIELNKGDRIRGAYWRRYTMINIERYTEPVNGFQVHEPKSWNGVSHK